MHESNISKWTGKTRYRTKKSNDIHNFNVEELVLYISGNNIYAHDNIIYPKLI